MKEVIVLAGGQGARLRSVLQNIPKPMAIIRGQPFLHYLLAKLVREGFKHIILSLGYRSGVIQSHFGISFMGIPISYVIESEPLGTGGAIQLAMTACTTDYVTVLNGDTYLDIDFSQVDNLWHTENRPILVGCKVPDVSRFGALEIDGDNLVGFSEKTKQGPGIINSGCYVLSVNTLENRKKNQYYSFEQDYLIPAVSKQLMKLLIVSGDFIDIGIPEDYLRAQALSMLV